MLLADMLASSIGFYGDLPMKHHRILCLCAAMALPQIALAELAFTAEALGRVQSTLDFCAEGQPRAATKYQEQAKILVQGVPKDKVDKVRSTDEYKGAYESAREELGKVSKHDVAEACTGFLETLK
jgi:hypothetical protein